MSLTSLIAHDSSTIFTSTLNIHKTAAILKGKKNIMAMSNVHEEVHPFKKNVHVHKLRAKTIGRKK